LSVAIEGYVKVNTDFDDVVDDICKEVEAALGADRTLNNLAKSQNITSGTEIQFNGEGDQPVGVVTMTYTVVNIGRQLLLQISQFKVYTMKLKSPDGKVDG
jgi:rRNA maturation endonuclease Nob1